MIISCTTRNEKGERIRTLWLVWTWIMFKMHLASLWWVVSLAMLAMFPDKHSQRGHRHDPAIRILKS